MRYELLVADPLEQRQILADAYHQGVLSEEEYSFLVHVPDTVLEEDFQRAARLFMRVGIVGRVK